MYKEDWDKSTYVDPEQQFWDDYERREAALDARFSTFDEYQAYMKSIKHKSDLKPRSVDSSWIGKDYVALPKKDEGDEIKSQKNKKQTQKTKQNKKVDLLRPEPEEKKEEPVVIKDFSESRTRLQTPNQQNMPDHLVERDLRTLLPEDKWALFDDLIKVDNHGEVLNILTSYKIRGYFYHPARPLHPEYRDYTDRVEKLLFRCITFDAYTTFISICNSGLLQPYQILCARERYRGSSLTSVAVLKYRENRNSRFLRFLYNDNIAEVGPIIRAAIDMNDFDLWMALCLHPDQLKYMGPLYMEDIYHWEPIHQLTKLNYKKFIDRLLIAIPKLDLDNATWTIGDSMEKRSHETPLMIAARYGHLGLVQLFVEKGADVALRDIWGKQASQLATNPDVQKYLKKIEDANVAKYARVSSYSNMAESVDVRTKAIKRLMRDMKEVWDSPLPTVWAYPLEYDLFQWHVVLSPPPRNNATEHAFYPFHGLKLHLILKFPDDYPRNPPKVMLSTRFKHPNVFGTYLCMDMLQPPCYGRVDEETGNRRRVDQNTWSSGYSAYSVLLQLQAFLFDERVPQYGNIAVENEISFWDRMEVYYEAMEFKCTECGYNIDYKGVDMDKATQESLLAVPPKEQNYVYNIKDWNTTKMRLTDMAANLDKIDALTPYKREKQAIKPYKGPGVIINLPDSAILEIFDYLPEMEDLSALMRTSRSFASVSHRYSVWTRRELVCFFSKRTWKEDILGIGLYVERHKSNKKLKTIRSPLHLISRTAFLEDEVRDSAWQEPFHYWLPVVINQRHAQHALPLIKSIFVAMLNNVSFEPKQRITEKERKQGPTMAELVEFDAKMVLLRNQFEPLMVLDILPRLMNHMVVALMKTNESGNGGGVLPLHDSEKALLGYCTYHHILLNLVNEFPIVQEKVDFFFKEFMSQPQRRVKKVIPDLGEMLVHLSIASTATWESIAEVFLQEFFDRTVVWMLDQKHGNHGELAYLESDPVSRYRLDTTLQTSRTSTRLLMFQVFFLRNVGRPNGLTLPQILKRYNDLYGRPQPGVPVMLQKENRKIHNIKSWQEFYDRIGLPYPGDEQMTHNLREAVRNSERKGYHVNNYTEKQLLEWRGRTDLMMTTYFDKYFPTFKDAPAAAAALQKEAKEQAEEAAKPVATTTEDSAMTAEDRKKWNSIPIANKVVVRNLAWKSTDDDVKWIFKQFGAPTFAKIMRDDQGKSRGFAFVAFPDESTVQVVLDYMKDAYLWSRKLEVTKFGDKPKPKSQPQPQKQVDLFAGITPDQEIPKPKKAAVDADGFTQTTSRHANTTSYNYNNNTNNNAKSAVKPTKPTGNAQAKPVPKAKVPSSTGKQQAEVPKKTKKEKKGGFSVLNVE